jgi:hypothetical protein
MNGSLQMYFLSCFEGECDFRAGLEEEHNLVSSYKMRETVGGLRLKKNEFYKTRCLIHP